MIYEFEQALGNGEGQGSPARCSPWGQKELDTPEQLNNYNENFLGLLQVSCHIKGMHIFKKMSSFEQ